MSAATENKVMEAYDTLSQAITHLDEWMAELGAENLRSNEAVEQVKKVIGFDSLSGGVTALQGDGSLMINYNLLESRVQAVERECRQQHHTERPPQTDLEHRLQACESKIVNMGVIMESHDGAAAVSADAGPDGSIELLTVALLPASHPHHSKPGG
eukprot:6471892-Amphidinium_carterae.1